MFKWYKKIKKELIRLSKEVDYNKDMINSINIHVKCTECGEIGHKPDMLDNPEGLFWGKAFYHKSCYCKKFNKVKCPNACNLFVDKK